MDRAVIEKRLADLEQLRQEQQERLAAAQQEQRAALTSLERIEGARQQCAWFLGQLETEAEGELAEQAAEQD